MLVFSSSPSANVSGSNTGVGSKLWTPIYTLLP
jgi:hypothetical protein